MVHSAGLGNNKETGTWKKTDTQIQNTLILRFYGTKGWIVQPSFVNTSPVHGNLRTRGKDLRINTIFEYEKQCYMRSSAFHNLKCQLNQHIGL